MMYGPIEIWSRFVWSSTRCFSAPRGPVATTANRSSRTTDTLSMRDLVPVLEALELDVMDAEALLAVQEVGQAVPEHRHLPGDRAIAGEADEIDGLHGPTLARGAYGARYGTFVPAGDGRAVTR